jgi:uncharacterized protein (TIGR03790 family)
MTSLAANPGDEVVVIYNSRLPQSKLVAEHYADRRNVPKNQVLGFDLTTNQDISRAEFRDALQKPLLRKLQSLKLWRLGRGEVPGTNGTPVRVEGKVLESKIRYVVLCHGVPLRITRDATTQEPAEETMRPELRRNEACVDSELAALPLINQHLPLAGPLRNALYAVTNASSLHPTNGVLLVTRLDGPTPEIARALVDKALQAENEGLWGRAYIDLRNTTDPAMKPGDDWIRGAGEVCRHAGFETIADTNAGTFAASFPMSDIAVYVGWYTETVNGPFALPKVEFMPGAFAYHLHSYSAAALRTSDHNWTGPLLARGATITMGSVDEPYLAGTPDVAVFTARLFLQGFTFGEAAYAGQTVLSWQTTVVGDPLYQPFKKPPPQLHQELEAKHSKLIEWSHLRVVNLNLVRGATLAEVVNYLETIPSTKTSAVLKEKLADLYATQGKPSSSVLTGEQALKLDPSPQQRIRLRLTLGERLLALNRDADAYADYQKFVEESPEYPDKVAIYQKLLSLAEKSGKKDDATKYGEQIKLLTAPAAAKP